MTKVAASSRNGSGWKPVATPHRFAVVPSRHIYASVRVCTKKVHAALLFVVHSSEIVGIFAGEIIIRAPYG